MPTWGEILTELKCMDERGVKLWLILLKNLQKG